MQSLAPALLVLWLLKATEPGVTAYVMAGDHELGEVQGPDARGRYNVRLEGPDGGDVVFTVPAPKAALVEAALRLRSWP